MNNDSITCFHVIVHVYYKHTVFMHVSSQCFCIDGIGGVLEDLPCSFEILHTAIAITIAATATTVRIRYFYVGTLLGNKSTATTTTATTTATTARISSSTISMGKRRGRKKLLCDDDN